MSTTLRSLAISIPALFAASLAVAAGHVISLQRVSILPTGNQSTSDSLHGVISADGRYVAFDTAGQVYVRDVVAGTGELISANATGNPGNASSRWPSISANGRYVGFTSDASDLVADDTNAFADVFVRDRQLGTTLRASVADGGTDVAGGGFGNFDDDVPTWMSSDGRYVVFNSSKKLTVNATSSAAQVYRRDLSANHSDLVSVNPSAVGANRQSLGGSISADGRFILFSTSATDIIAAAPTDLEPHAYVRDMSAGTTVSAAPSTSGGTPCAQESAANGTYYLSTSGRFALYNSSCDDLASGQSTDDSLFVRDLVLGSTHFLRLGSGGVIDPGAVFMSMTNSGRYLIAASQTPNLVVGDTDSNQDVFLQDQISLTTYSISQRPDNGAAANGGSTSPLLGSGGRIVFSSVASNLVDGDTNGVSDIFVATLDYLFDAGFD